MTIATVSIVKNEAETLPRMLASVSDLVDMSIVVDTGSTDDTVEIARSLGADVYEREWVDFGHNLTEAFSLATHKANWLLRMDADMLLSWHPNFLTWLDEASSDAYTVEIVENGGKWRLPLLMTGAKRWTYVGATHEYLDTTGREVSDLVGLTVAHAADGSNRSNKFRRDIKMLAPAVERGDERAIFYTAESYRNAGDLGKAIEMYDRRASMPETWEEEAWYAAYQAGCCALKLDEPDAVDRLLAAWRRRPTRAEPLRVIERWCATHAPTATPDDNLFIDHDLYGRNSTSETGARG